MADPVKFIQTGRVWKLGNAINTDLIQPNAAFRLPQNEQHKLVLSAVRPGWVEQVKPGDMIVAGENFGMGSSRPIGALLRACGITGIVADSFNGMGFRSCVNAALPALECAGVTSIFEEGDMAHVDFTSGHVENLGNKKKLQGKPPPEFILDIVRAGGIVPMLIASGLIEPRTTNASPV